MTANTQRCLVLVTYLSRINSICGIKSGRLNKAGRVPDMVIEIPANEPALIPYPVRLLMIGVEQQARVLDAASRNYELSGRNSYLVSCR